MIRKNLKNLYLTIFTIIFCSIIIEFLASLIVAPLKESGQIEQIGESVSLRLKLYPSNRDQQYTPTNDYLNKTNHSIEKKVYRLQTDTYQSITSSRRGQPEFNENNIMFLGGSTTETRYVTEEKRWPLLVAENLTKNSEVNWVGYNYGVSGNNLAHSTINYFTYKRIIRPKIVVVHHLINDINLLYQFGNYFAQESNEKSFLIQSDPEFDTPLFSFLRFLKNNIFDDTYLMIRLAFPNIGLTARRVFSTPRSLLESPVQTGKERNLLDKEYLQFAWRENEEELLNAIWVRYEEQLDELISLIKSNNATPIILLQGINSAHIEFLGLTGEEKFRLEKNFYTHVWANNKLKEKLLNQNILFIDLRPFGSPNNMYDHMHYNEKGSVEIANHISRRINSILKSHNPEL